MPRSSRWIRWGLLAGIGLVGAACVGPRLETEPMPGEAQVIFFDDFTSHTLDRSKWNVIITGFTVNNEQQAYVDSPLTIYFVSGVEAEGASNGALVLHARYSPGFVTPQGKTFDFISGRMNTRGKMEFMYGSAAARMKLPLGSGYWPAFWALGNGRWPDIGEIDIMEYVGEMSWSSVALHGSGYSGNTPIVKREEYPDGTDAADWHVYSVDWSPEEIVFRVDGTAIYEVTKAMVEAYGPWAFDNPKFLIVNLALGGGYPFGVNGVDIPYYGIPDSTVGSIQAGEGKVLVDWVRVTQNPAP